MPDSLESWNSAPQRDEARRRAYLESMGIDFYWPRFPLPGAAPSIIPTVPTVEAAGQRQIETAAAVETGVAIEAVDAIELIETVDAVETVERVDAREAVGLVASNESVEPVATPRAVEQPPADAEVRFQLLFIRINDSVCVLNQLPYAGGRQSLAPDEQRLLANICRAVGLDPAGMLIDGVPFRWPLSQSGHIDKSEGAARGALHAYLSQKFAGHDVKVLLVLGSTISGFLSAGDGVAGGRIALDGRSCETVFTRSLGEMLQMPQLKREVWECLRTRSWHDLH